MLIVGGKAPENESVDESEKNDLDSVDSSEPTKLHYIAHGDCGGAWNPGHCTADPLNFSVVQKLLGVTKKDTVAYLMRGLNYDDLANTNGDTNRPLFALWESLAQRVYPRKFAYENMVSI